MAFPSDPSKNHSGPPDGYEVVCDGGVCEMRPTLRTAPQTLVEVPTATCAAVSAAGAVAGGEGSDGNTTVDVGARSASDEKAGSLGLGYDGEEDGAAFTEDVAGGAAESGDGVRDGAQEEEEEEEEVPLTVDPDVSQLVSKLQRRAHPTAFAHTWSPQKWFPDNEMQLGINLGPCVPSSVARVIHEKIQCAWDCRGSVCRSSQDVIHSWDSRPILAP